MFDSYLSPLFPTAEQTFTEHSVFIFAGIRQNYLIHLCSLTGTFGTRILGMITIMYLISVVAAVKDTRFSSITTYIIECYVPRASSKATSRASAPSIPIPHTPADNVSVVQVPVVIAHSSPGAVVENFYSAFTIGTTTNKSSFWKP